MIKKTIIVLLSSFVLLAAAVSVSANSPFDIEFPIAELGGCADKGACAGYCDDAANGVSCAEFAALHGLGDRRSVEAAKTIQEGGPGGCASEESCRAYCEDLAHETECIDFAVSKGFMTRAEADRALKPGPGGCRGRACQAYCEDPAHEEECFEFGVENGFIPKEEAQRIREFKKKFGEKREGPGGCRGEEQCRAYCNEPSHIDACLAFAEDHGFVDREQARIIKKTHGTGPGGCKGADACREYCDNPGNQSACIDFAAENGFMTQEEANRVRKIAGKTGPGGCQGEQCRDFCNQPGNEDACLEFAEREGLIPKEELERARKFSTASRDGGPGGCRGIQCRDYCEDPAHREECFGFAKKNGLISEEEQKQFEAGSKIQEVVKSSGGPGGCKSDDECRTYCADPSHVEECIAFGATHSGVPPEQVRAMLKQFTERRFEARGGAGEFGPQGFEDFQRFEQDSNRRFDEFRMLEEQFRGQEFPGFGGPGGPGPDGFPGGEFPGGPGAFPGGPGGNSGGHSFAGPGGCTSPAECIKYCTENKDACFGGGPQDNGGSAGRSDDRGGRPGFGGERGGASFGPPPQLRGGLIRQFEQGELPEGFRELPSEERQRFFHDRFPEFNPPSPGQFPGRPPQEFPGAPSEFPGGGEFPSRAPEGFPDRPEEFPGGREGFRPPEGFGPERIQQLQQLQQQIQEGGSIPDLQQRLQQLQQFPTPTSGGVSPDSGGAFHPPEGSFIQPSTSGTFQQPPEGSFTQPPPSGSFSAPQPTGSFESAPPPSGSFSAPPPSGGSQPPPPPPPSGFRALLNGLGGILNALIR